MVFAPGPRCERPGTLPARSGRGLPRSGGALALARRPCRRTEPRPEHPLATTGSVTGEPADPQALPEFAVFFVPPTSYIQAGGDWNAALGDATTDNRARLFLRGLASPFNRADEIWAPKYRQAAAGAFLTDRPEAQQAIDAAYADVAQAFDYFLDSIADDKPIVLAGHSQGASHILRLLQEKVAGTPVAERVAAVYAPGWPISVEHDLPVLPFPACAAPGSRNACWRGRPFPTTAMRT